MTLPLALYAGSGSDTITDQGSGDDLLVVARPTDTITHTGANSATIEGGAGSTTITTGPANDTIHFGTGITTLHEGNGWNTPEILDDSDGSAAGANDTYVESGSGWTNGTAGRASTAPNGSMPRPPAFSAAAIWTFANLAPTAYYDVYVTWSPHAVASTAAQYVVCDGDTPIKPSGRRRSPR